MLGFPVGAISNMIIVNPCWVLLEQTCEVVANKDPVFGAHHRNCRAFGPSCWRVGMLKRGGAFWGFLGDVCGTRAAKRTLSQDIGCLGGLRCQGFKGFGVCFGRFFFM